MKKLTGLFAAVMLMSSGVALAHQGKQQSKQQTQSQSGTGGSGTQVGQTGTTTPLGGSQLTGRVVKSERGTIWVEHEGAIVPLKIDKNTLFTDPTLKRATDYKEGDEIRASFEVRKTDNVATSIAKSTATGQGGSGVMSPNQGVNQPPETLPPSNKGTSGSSSDINQNPDSNLGNPSNQPSGDY